MTIKKLLCKYCSENKDHKTVTVGSIIDSIIELCIIIAGLLMGLFILFMLTLMLVNGGASTLKEAITSVLTAWGIAVLVIILVSTIVYLYVKSHEVQITKCERDE